MFTSPPKKKTLLHLLTFGYEEDSSVANRVGHIRECLHFRSPAHPLLAGECAAVAVAASMELLLIFSWKRQRQPMGSDVVEHDGPETETLQSISFRFGAFSDIASFAANHYNPPAPFVLPSPLCEWMFAAVLRGLGCGGEAPPHVLWCGSRR